MLSNMKRINGTMIWSHSFYKNICKEDWENYMFGIGKNKSKHSELEAIVEKTHMYMSNNYKDAARESFELLKKKYAELKEKGVLKQAQIDNYEMIISDLSIKFEKYSHKQM